MYDLKKRLDTFPEPEAPENLHEGVMRRIERGERRPLNPLLVPGLACISCGVILSIVLGSGLAEKSIEWIQMIGGFFR